jgi:hypothetical protein
MWTCKYPHVKYDVVPRFAVAVALVLVTAGVGTGCSGPSGGSPAASATTDAAAVDACRQVNQDADATGSPDPTHLQALGSRAAESTDPAIRAAGTKLRTAAQASMQAGPDDASALEAALSAEIDLAAACGNAGY